ncbi:MAG: hypothetical protein E5V80_26965 [Mesorhizobium sp.]|nr:MAG: hypothetical protein E5V80_26965 [Mesorhizobium sp.]
MSRPLPTGWSKPPAHKREAANAQAKLSNVEARIVHLELRIDKLKPELYGRRWEVAARLIDTAGTAA